MRLGGEVVDFLKEYRNYCREQKTIGNTGYFWGKFNLWKNRGRWIDADKAEQMLANFLKSEFWFIPLESKSRDYWSIAEKELTFDADLNLLLPGMILPDEKTVGNRAWFDEHAAFRIKCDYIERRGASLLIVDEKTGWTTPEPLQLEIAQHLAPRGFHPGQLLGVFHVEAIYNILSGYKPKAERLPVLSLEEAGSIGETIKGWIQEVNTWPERYGEDYPAELCSRCGNCTVPTCPIERDVIMALANVPGSPRFTLPERIDTAEDAQRAVTFLVFAESLDKKIKALLKSYVDTHGRVVSGGMAAEYTDAESFDIEDLGTLLDTMLAYGAKKEQILDAISMTKTGFNTVVKKAGLAQRLPMLMQLIRTRTSRRFGINKDKGEVKQDMAV